MDCGSPIRIQLSNRSKKGGRKKEALLAQLLIIGERGPGAHGIRATYGRSRLRVRPDSQVLR